MRYQTIYQEAATGMLEAFKEVLDAYPGIRRYLIDVSRPVSMGWTGTDFQLPLLEIIFDHLEQASSGSHRKLPELNEQCFYAAQLHEKVCCINGGRMRFWRVK